MTRFALRYPYFIIVFCLITVVVGMTSLLRMPVDLFPPIRIPVVVVVTFYNGMAPQDIENDITGRFERFFTLGSGIDHIESRSLAGVSLIKVYFQPGFDPNTAVSSIANLAMADLRRLPPGTLPPVVLQFDASSLPVCLVTLKGKDLTEAQLRDYGQFNVRDQIANVPGASVPPPFGGKYRQIMVYVDPLKLEAHQLSVMDVVRTVNDANLILPAGDVKVGRFDYNLYANSQVPKVSDLNEIPLKTISNASVLVADVGRAEDAAQIQSQIVRVDGQHSVYLPILKQGGDVNTIAVVDGIRSALGKLKNVPQQLVAKLVFDQSAFVKTAIETLVHEGLIGLVLTGLMILLFLGSMRATLAVFLSIPLSALATFIALQLSAATVNAMILGGLALVFSRLIDNSVVVLENIYRHLEQNEQPVVAAEKGGTEVALPVLAATLTTIVVFFPVAFLYGVSKFLFVALALAVVLALLASYFVALTVVPLFCAKFIKSVHGRDASGSRRARFNAWFNQQFARLLDTYERALKWALQQPVATLIAILGLFVLSLGIFPFVGVSYFPRTDPGQFIINLKAPTGTRIELTDDYAAQVEKIVREVVAPADLDLIVANLGVVPGLSAMYTPNSAVHTGFVQVGLKANHRIGSYEYMERVRRRVRTELPDLVTYFQSGGLVDAVLNMGLPAPIDLQISGFDLDKDYQLATGLARQIRAVPGVSDVLIPQDIDYPAVRVNVDRLRASELGLSSKEVINNLITALTSDGMIAPSYWVDPKTGNDYLLTVQYPENHVVNFDDLKAIPLRATDEPKTARLDTVVKVEHFLSPTEVDHYQLERVIDVFVSPQTEDLGGTVKAIDRILGKTPLPPDTSITLRGMVQNMRASFRSFGLGLILSVVLVYLILVAQFQSWIDPLLILLAVPTGLSGVLVTLYVTSTTLNVMSLMGVVMMVGIVVSNSILLVEFTHRLRRDGQSMDEAITHACRVRLRPILMTSLATLIGLLPMAMKLGAGSEAYAPLARSIIGGLAVSVVLTMFIVPAAYQLVYRGKPYSVESMKETV